MDLRVAETVTVLIEGINLLFFCDVEIPCAFSLTYPLNPPPFGSTLGVSNHWEDAMKNRR